LRGSDSQGRHSEHQRQPPIQAYAFQADANSKGCRRCHGKYAVLD